MPGTEVLDRVLAGKQPATIKHLVLGTSDTPPDPQAFE